MDPLLRSFDNVMTQEDRRLKTKNWCQFASYHIKSSEKRIGKTYILLLKKNLQGNPVNTGNRRDMPWCPYNPGVPISAWAFRKKRHRQMLY